MAFANANFRSTRYDTSSDDSDNFDEFLKTLRTPSAKPAVEDDINDFIASDSSIVYCDSSGDEENNDLGFHLCVTNQLNNLSLSKRKPLKPLSTNENFSPVFDSPAPPRNNWFIHKEGADSPEMPKIKKTPFKTKIIFSSSDDSDCELIPNEIKSPQNSNSETHVQLPQDVVDLTTQIEKNSPPSSPVFTKPKFNFPPMQNPHSLNYVSLKDRLKPNKISEKRPGSLGEIVSTPVKSEIPKVEYKTEKIVHTKSKVMKGSDGLPDSLPPKSSFGKQFKSQKELLTSLLYKHFNSNVFDNKLDANMLVEWSKRLTKTAGITKCKRKRITKFVGGKQIVETDYSSSITLSEKVIDNLQRLRDTLIHEMCHAAVWVINNINEGHGPYWKWWAKKASTKFPDMPVIKRCHSYDISYKYYYKCTTCKQQIGRHSKSINTEKIVCGICKGKLILLSNVNDPNTPAKSRTPNKFAMFVKENYNTYKEKEMRSTSVRPKHGDIMKILSKEFAKMNT